MTAIIDFHDKEKVIFRVLNCKSPKDLANKVLVTSKDKVELLAQTEAARRLADNWRKWKAGGEPRETEFFDKLALVLGMPQHIKGMTLITASFAEFCARLSPEYQDLATELMPPRPKSEATAADKRFAPIFANMESEVETAADGLRRGRIEQKFFYLSPESAGRWYKLINDHKYEQFAECRQALARFVESETWQTFLHSGETDGVVMLGGGGTQKDMVLVESVIDSNRGGKPFHYAIVDISYYMLFEAFRYLSENYGGHTIAFKAVVADFLDLRGARGHLRRPDKNVAWFLPGGTLGNLHERRFTESIRKKSEPGDLLVLGVEMIDDRDPDGHTKALRKKYEHRAMKEFISTPLRAAWSVIDTDEKIADVLDRVIVNVVDHHVGSGYSVIPGSKTVVISAPIKGRDTVLLSSTRYEPAKLSSFMSEAGFEHLESVISPANPQFHHLVLRRKP